MDIIIADDHDIFRQSLAFLISSHSQHNIVGDAASFDALLTLTNEALPDCVLLDYHMPGGHPVQITERLKRQHPQLKIVMLTGSQSCNVLKQLHDSPADGVLHKKDNAATILEAIDSIALGHRYISAMVDEMVEHARVNLTQRELQILELLLAGRSPVYIAENLRISPRTVEKHKENMMKKLGAANSMELIETGHRLVMQE